MRGGTDMAEKLRLIQAGVGGMGKAWRANATKASAEFEVVAVVDINRVALDEAGEELNVPPERRFEDLRAAGGGLGARRGGWHLGSLRWSRWWTSIASRGMRGGRSGTFGGGGGLRICGGRGGGWGRMRC